MKILLVADNEAKYIWDFFQPEKFADIDLILSCGDLKADYLSFLVTMIKAPLFYVPGNHDTKFNDHPPEGCDSIDGKLITFNGIRILGLGGSMKYNRGGYQYTEAEMKKRIWKLKPRIWLNGGFDILVAHSPMHNFGDGSDLCHTGFQGFNKLIDKYSPKYFVHGHEHLNYGLQKRIQKYKNTTVINAYEYYIIEF